MEELKSTFMNVILPNKEYIVGKFSLLKNDEHTQYDQMPHRDYPPRLITWVIGQLQIDHLRTINKYIINTIIIMLLYLY